MATIIGRLFSLQNLCTRLIFVSFEPEEKAYIEQNAHCSGGGCGQTDHRQAGVGLDENGIKNPVGGAFTYNSVEHMLKNRRYIGELKFRDVVVPDAISSIVSAELFNDVQEKMLKNKKAPARRKAEDDYLLTTKLYCGYCGALMFGESGTSRTGEVHRYYKCATAKKKKGCKKKTVRKQWLEDLVVNQTMQLVRDDAAMESIIAKVMELQDRENINLPLYEKQLRDAESGIQNMLNAIQAGILTSSTKERLEQLEETKRELEARIAEEKLAKPKVTEEFIRFWLLRFRKLDMSLKDQRQALVDTFINSIYLYDDKVLITFNYKEGTQTITFEEAAQAASKGNGSDLDCLAAPQQQNPNFFPIGEGFGFFVFFGKQNESLASIEKRPRPYQKKARQITVRVPQGRKDTNMKYDERACKFNMDTGCVELLLRDGRMISIDCTGVEDELDVTMAQRSELDYLIYNDPLGYADLILNGDPEKYLKNVAGSHGLED